MSSPPTSPDGLPSEQLAPPVDTALRSRPFYWSVRREVWENRSLYVAPLIVAGVFLFAIVLSLADLPRRRLALLSLDAGKQAATVAAPYEFAAAAAVLTTVVVGVVYCLGALHGERRDRSILFWKSLPVSDRVTVFAKAAVPMAVLPAIAIVVTVALQVAILVLTGAVLLANGTPSTTATQAPLLQMTGVLLYGVATSTLWWAPLYAWLLLISGWAKRVPFLWAFLPPLGLCLIERIAFNSTRLATLLRDRLIGGYGEAFAPSTASGARGPHGVAVAAVPQIDPVKFLSSPGLWIGLIVAAGLLAATVRLRHRREPI